MTDAPKPTAKPATPKTPEPETIIEFVDVVDRRIVLAAIIGGIVLGAIVVYLALSKLTVEDVTDA